MGLKGKLPWKLSMVDSRMLREAEVALDPLPPEAEAEEEAVMP